MGPFCLRVLPMPIVDLKYTLYPISPLQPKKWGISPHTQSKLTYPVPGATGFQQKNNRPKAAHYSFKFK